MTRPGGLVQFLGPFGGVPVVLASLAACSLALSPGPRRGLAVVGWWRACLMIAALSAGFGFPFIVLRVHPAALALTGDLAFRLLGILAIVLAVAVTRVPGPVGWRVAGLVAAGLVPSLAVLLADIAPPAGADLARRPARRRAGVAGGDRILARAGRAGRARGVTPGLPCPASAETSRAIAWGISGRVGWPRLTCARTRNMAVFAQVKTGARVNTSVVAESISQQMVTTG